MEIKKENYGKFVGEIKRIARFYDKAMKENDDTMIEYSFHTLLTLIQSYQILFDAKYGFNKVLDKYIGDIIFEDKNENIIEKINIITKEELNEFMLKRLNDYKEKEKQEKKKSKRKRKEK